MIKLVSSAPTKITPKVAADLLENNVYEYQRPLSQLRVDRYAHLMEAGEFTPCDIKVAQLVAADNLGVIVNGQHTLHAIVKCGIPQHLVVTVCFCDTEEDIAHWYSTIDIQKPRTTIDKLRAQRFDITTGIPLHTAKRMTAAIRFSYNRFLNGGGKTDNEAEVLADIADWVPAINAFLTLKADKYVARRMLKRDVLGVALVTLKAHPDKALKFWQAVVEDDGLRKSDPRKTLVNWIRMTVNLYENDAMNVRKNDTPAYGARAVAACWNAAWKGNDLTRIYVGDFREPIKILGTEFKG